MFLWLDQTREISCFSFKQAIAVYFEFVTRWVDSDLLLFERWKDKFFLRGIFEGRRDICNENRKWYIYFDVMYIYFMCLKQRVELGRVMEIFSYSKPHWVTLVSVNDSLSLYTVCLWYLHGLFHSSTRYFDCYLSIAGFNFLVNSFNISKWIWTIQR